MIPLTTARKATVSAVVAALSPLYVLLQSDQPVTWRGVLAGAVGGIVGYLGTYAVSNTEPYQPAQRHAADRDGA